MTPLNKLKIMIKTMKNTNALYICSEDQWKQKINNYIEQTGVFSLIGSFKLKILDNHASQQILINMCDKLVGMLHEFYIRKAITTEQYEQMMYFNQSTRFQVNELYFIPELRENQVSIRPMLTCNRHEPIKAIARFLNILREPLIERVARFNTCTTGTQAIQAFEKYTKQGYLRSSTLFVTIHTHDYCTTFPHHLIIEILEDFLHIHARNQLIEGTPTTTIVRLVQFILQNQFFIYKNKLYHQTSGGLMSSPLIMTLIDLYLFYWERDLVSRLNIQNELFGRSHNQIFFTWNKSKDELLTLLDQKNFTNSKYAHIQITASIDHKIKYLDAEIIHYEGILRTRVHHDSIFEPYALPYVFETTQTESHFLLLRAALSRAILYCSNVDEFENERLFIDLSFIINDVSLDFIQKTTENFLIEFKVFMVDTCIDDDTYQYLRQRSSISSTTNQLSSSTTTTATEATTM